jgi:hypothetical protein
MTFMDKVDGFLIKAEDKFNNLIGKKVVIGCLYLWLDKINGSEHWMVMGKKVYIPANDGDKMEQLEWACAWFIDYSKYKLIIH